MKYKIEYDFMNTDMLTTDGKFHHTYLDNNGQGFTIEEAEELAYELIRSNAGYNRNIEIVEM